MSGLSIVSIIGAVLAVGGTLWYTLRSSAAEKQSLDTAIGANTTQAAKIKALDDRIVDSEYQRRIAEKTRNAQIVQSNDATTAGRVLVDATKGNDP